MDEDGKNLTPEVDGANESSLDDDLLAGFDAVADAMPQNGGSLDPDGGSTDSNPDEGEGAGDTNNDGEGGQTDTDDASANDDTAKASAGEPAKESVAPAAPSKEDRIKERKLAALEKAIADSEGITIYEKIAEATGETEEEVKARIESDDLTTEEKAALYDKEHSMTEAEKREAAGKQFFNKLLAEIHEAYPETADTVKKPSDIEDEETFRLLILNGGKSAVEAFKMTNAGKIKRNAPPPNGKGHLYPDAKTTRSGGSISVPASELQYYRDMFPDMKDSEIEKLYHKVTN